MFRNAGINCVYDKERLRRSLQVTLGQASQSSERGKDIGLEHPDYHTRPTFRGPRTGDSGARSL